MSGRSGAISHTTLYEATKGNRLPSWETTVEFIKACGADPADYRARWEQANRTVRGASAAGVPVTASGSPALRATESDLPDLPLSDQSTDRASPPPGRERPRLSRTAPANSDGPIRPRLSTPAKAVLAVAVFGAGAAAFFTLSGDPGSGADEPTGSPATVVPGPADCPVLTPNPPPSPPAHAGDLAVFVADVTLIDCARVPPDEPVTKVWRLQNAGTVPWNGYSLRRLDSPQQIGRCQTIAEVPIDDTPPGATVEIRAQVTPQKSPGLCYMLFKMVDAEGRIAFPGTRPVNFQIIIDPQAPAVHDTAGAARHQEPSTIPE
ncbi:NBR1-Ig-like domain-containing protein [Actinocorallia aurea]